VSAGHLDSSDRRGIVGNAAAAVAVLADVADLDLWLSGDTERVVAESCRYGVARCGKRAIQSALVAKICVEYPLLDSTAESVVLSGGASAFWRYV
jgi:hypothetical protein